METDEVLIERPVRGDVADHGLPGVAVGVDQARHHDPAADVDPFRVGRFQLTPDGGDLAVSDQYVSRPEDGV
ncbi:hypothetical protein ACFQX6_09375 [Streptosporangium lutulentum]